MTQSNNRFGIIAHTLISVSLSSLLAASSSAMAEGAKKSPKKAEAKPAKPGLGSAPADASKAKSTTGECWGVNECKGQGQCGGKGHECAGKNECKGQGWIASSKKDCDEKKGTFKADLPLHK